MGKKAAIPKKRKGNSVKRHQRESLAIPKKLDELRERAKKGEDLFPETKIEPDEPVPVSTEGMLRRHQQLAHARQVNQ